MWHYGSHWGCPHHHPLLKKNRPWLYLVITMERRQNEQFERVARCIFIFRKLDLVCIVIYLSSTLNGQFPRGSSFDFCWNLSLQRCTHKNQRAQKSSSCGSVFLGLTQIQRPSLVNSFNWVAMVLNLFTKCQWIKTDFDMYKNYNFFRPSLIFFQTEWTRPMQKLICSMLLMWIQIGL